MKEPPLQYHIMVRNGNTCCTWMPKEQKQVEFKSAEMNEWTD